MILLDNSLRRDGLIYSMKQLVNVKLTSSFPSPPENFLLRSKLVGTLSTEMIEWPP